MSRVSEFLGNQYSGDPKKNVVPYRKEKDGKTVFTYGRPPNEWLVYELNGREVLYQLTFESLESSPYLSDQRDVVEIWGYCWLVHSTSLPYLTANPQEVIVFEEISSLLERENLRRELQRLYRKVVFKGEQEEWIQKRDTERAREQRRCPRGGEHVWTSADCFDAYGVIYTVTCGKCRCTQETFDWQMATRIQLQDIGMDIAGLAADLITKGSLPQVERHIQEAKNVAGEALRLVEENS